MANKPAEKVGRGPCPQCGEAVTFKRSAGGLLNYSCDVCDTSGYSRPGGTGYAKWLQSITVTHHANPGAKPEAAPPAASPAPKVQAKPKTPPEPTATPKPTAAPVKARGFSLEDL